ncbi:energy-coupling factor transport system ATP-binding protein [Alkalibaculum bacchi]|uniref:Energy-coupling factor transport system ATP-binding protein n=1 Tax=Alkalibaculum bacchi TaxID=645887 RepID=A0A366I8I9_9FIRM|nr:ABC transporter ATP-binding protein [Alkalibaculum bacchi]RBP63798.1 energy-coupling factor transport system ATP-binding protein [Alkalibaculum bacchi]
MLEVKIKNLCYAEGEEWSLEEINTHIEYGELVFLTGSPRSGKTTLCQVVAGVLPNFTDCILEGTVQLDGEDIVTKDLPEVAGKVAYVRDEPKNQLFSFTVEEDLGFGPCSLLVEEEEVKRRIKRALDFVGLEGYEKRKSHTLSGGEAQRAVLASVLTLDPKILILDEAVTQIDPKGRKDIYERLGQMAKKEKKIVIIVDNKVDNYFSIDHRLLVLDEGKLLYDGPMRRDKLPKFIKPIKSQKVTTLFKTLDPVLSVENVSFQYGNGEFGLENINLKVYPGEFISLMGKNGAGKTTLAKHFNGLYKPSKGNVWVKNMNTREHSTAQLSKKVGYLFQDPQIQLFTNSVEEEVSFALRVQKLPKDEIVERTKKILDEMNLSQYAQDHPYTLSKGDVQKLALASSLINEPEILIIDEPTSQMSFVESWRIMEIISRLTQKGVAVIMISHDLELALHYSSRMVVLKEGHIELDIRTNECFIYKKELYDLGLDICEDGKKGEEMYETIVGI